MKRVLNKPDSAAVSAVNQIRMNPRFVKLLNFSSNVLIGLTKLPNVKHRDNAEYIIHENGHKNIIQTLVDHQKNETVVMNSISLLNNIIGAKQFREEKIAQLLVQEELIPKLINLLNQQLQPETRNAIYDLIDNIILSPQIATNLIQSGMLNTMYQQPEKQTILTKTLNILQLPQVQKDLTNVIDIAHSVVGLLQTQSILALQVIEQLISKPANLEQIVKNQIITREKLLKLIDAKQSKQVNVIAAKILSQIVDSDEIAQACQSIKKIDDKTVLSIELISNLLFADQDKQIVNIEEIIGDLYKIIKKHKEILEREDGVGIINNVLLALNRIIDINGPLEFQDELMSIDCELLDIKLLFAAILENLRRLNTSHLSEHLPKIIQLTLLNFNSQSIQQSALQLFILVHHDIQDSLDELIQHLFKLLLQTDFVTELASRLLYLLANEYEILNQAMYLPEIISQKRNQRLACLYLFKTCNVVLVKDSSKIPNLLEPLIQVLYPKSLLIQENMEMLSQEQKKDLIQVAKQIIQLLVTEGDIFSYFKELQDAVKEFKYDSKKYENVEIAILKLAYMILLDNLGSFTLKIDVFQFLTQQYFNNNGIILALLKYISNQAQLYQSEKCKDEYIAKDIALLTFNYIMTLLTKTEDEDVIYNALQALIALVPKKGQQQFQNKDLLQTVLKTVKQIMSNHCGEVNLQVKCLEVFKVYLHMDEFLNLLLEDLTFLVQPLKDENNQLQIGINCIQVLYAIGYRSKQNVSRLFQMKVQNSVFQFIKNNENCENARVVSQPLLLLLSTYNQEVFFTKALETEIMQLLGNVDSKKDINVICNSVMQLSIYSLVDILFGFMCQNNLINKLCGLLSEYKSDPYFETIQTDKIISYAALLLTKASIASTISKEITKENIQSLHQNQICLIIMEIISQRTHSPKLIYESLLFISNAFKQQNLNQQLVSFIELNQIYFSTLILLSSKYEKDESITKVINIIQFEIIKSSKIIIQKPQVQRFLPNLVRRTETMILFEGAIKENQINQNLRWILQLSNLQEFKSVETQIVELSYTLIQFETSSERIMVIKSPQQKQRSSTINRKLTQKYRSDSKNLEIVFQILQIFKTIPSNQQLLHIMNVLKNFESDFITLENCLVYIQDIINDQQVIQNLKNLDAENVLKKLQANTTYYKVHDLINKILVKFPQDEFVKEEIVQNEALSQDHQIAVETSKEQFELDRLKQQIKKLTNENDSLKKENQLKNLQIQELTSVAQDSKEQIKNYTEEFLDQTRIIGEKLIQLKKAESQIKELKEEIKKLNEITGGGVSLQEQQMELNQQLELQLQQNQQLEMLCEQQLNEIDLLNQVKNEQDLLIQELQKSANYEKTAEAQLTKEDVGTPDDSKDSEIYAMEDELEQKNVYIQQLLQQLQDQQEMQDKMKFLEDKNKVLKLKLAVSDQKNLRNYWDIVITSPDSSIKQLALSSWDFLILNQEEIDNFHQSVSVFSFDASILQDFVNTVFNYSHQGDGILNTLSSYEKTYIKTMSPPFLQANKKAKRSFILNSKLLDRRNYSKSSYVLDDIEDHLAFEEFWLQYSFSQNGFVVFVCKELGSEEYELLKKMCYIQLLQGQQRLIVFVQKDAKVLTGELQMMEGKAGQEMKFPRVFYNMSNQMNQIMVSLLKQDKSKNSYAFVDQIREFIVGNYQNYLKGELVDFGIGELDEGEGFKLNIMMKEEKVKLQKSRVTDLIQSEVKVNVKYDEDEVKLEVYGGWDEKIEKCKVKSYNQEYGCKVYLKLECEQEDQKQEYRMVQKLKDKWKVKKVEKEKRKVEIKLVKEE